MGGVQAGEPGRDLRGVVAGTDVPEGGFLKGTIDGEPALLVRSGGSVHAVGAVCTHYGAPLEAGLIAEGTIRCPWHHACFRLATGAATAPALKDLPSWDVSEREGRISIGALRPAPGTSARPTDGTMIVVGAGAAGSAAADALRREGYGGRVLLVDTDDEAPYDRPNLSKDYLAGDAPEEWLPLREGEYFRTQRIERLAARVEAIDPAARRVRFSDRQEVTYDALLLATGATPIRLPIPGAELPHVHVLRSLADCRALIGALTPGSSVVVAGASFIGMETAAALRARGARVTVVAPEAVPFARTLGARLGGMLHALHEAHGVEFRLGHTLSAVEPGAVVLDDGERIPANLVVVGVGVRPDVALAQAAGLTVDDGVVVDGRLESSAPGIFAAGDIASWPDADTGERRRVEHWVVAQRQGAHAARAMLGAATPFRDVPFFWTRQFDVTVAYSGYARLWDREEVSGSPAEHDCAVRYYRSDRAVAIATVNRDRENLEFELAEQRHGVEAAV